MKSKAIKRVFFIFYTIFIITSSILIVKKIDNEYSNYMYDAGARVMLGVHNDIESQANIINKLYNENLSDDELDAGKEILRKYGISNKKKNTNKTLNESSALNCFT